MEKAIRFTLIVLVLSLMGYVGYMVYESFKQSVLEQRLQAEVSGTETKEAEEDCGCQEAKNSNHHQKNEISRELSMTDLVVESYAQSN